MKDSYPQIAQITQIRAKESIYLDHIKQFNVMVLNLCNLRNLWIVFFDGRPQFEMSSGSNR